MVKKKNKKTKPEGGKTRSFTEILGIEKIMHNEQLNFIIGLLLFIVSIYMALAFTSFFTTGAADQSMIEELREGEFSNQKHEFANYCGSIGAYMSWFFIKRCFGIPAFLIPAFLLVVSLHLMKAYRVNLGKWFLSLMVAMVWGSVMLAKFLSPFFAESHFNPGGDHGKFACQQIEGLMGTPGLTAILAVTALALLTYISAETIYVIRKLLNPRKFLDKVKFKITNDDPDEQVDSYESQILEDPEVFDDPEEQTVEFTVNDTEMPVQPSKPVVPAAPEDPGFEIETTKVEEAADKPTLVSVGDEQLEPYDPKRDLENYHYPTLDLLKKYENDGKPYIDMEEQTKNKNRIVEVLRTFGVEISTIKATVGPTITLYEITLAPGIRISKVRSLEDDIALSLSALGIRIIAPIPGKGTIGIEVPNAKPSIVSMESILNSKKFQETTMDLPCAMGKTITNEVFMFDLAKAPHLLVAGATGQGKSVGLNAILTSLLYKKHPAEMKIVLVDPKMVEFSIYKTIERHFLAALPEEVDNPIITDTSKVVRTLNSLCVEMDAR